MATIGNQITSTSFTVDTFSGTGSQTAFTGLTFAPASTAAISVYVAGVYQSPINREDLIIQHKLENVVITF